MLNETNQFPEGTEIKPSDCCPTPAPATCSDCNSRSESCPSQPVQPTCCGTQPEPDPANTPDAENRPEEKCCDNQKYTPCGTPQVPTNGTTFGLALEAVKKGKGMRLPQWSPDVVIRAQYPDANSKMTAPYLYVESRFGRVPWKETMIELFAENWVVVD